MGGFNFNLEQALAQTGRKPARPWNFTAGQDIAWQNPQPPLRLGAPQATGQLPLVAEPALPPMNITAPPVLGPAEGLLNPPAAEAAPRSRFEAELEAMNQPVSLKQRLIGSGLAALPTVLGGIFGGQAGATGAAQGTTDFWEAQRARHDTRRNRLEAAIMAEQEAERQALGAAEANQLRQQQMAMEAGRARMENEQRAATLAEHVRSNRAREAAAEEERAAAMNKPLTLSPGTLAVRPDGTEIARGLDPWHAQPRTRQAVEFTTEDGKAHAGSFDAATGTYYDAAGNPVRGIVSPYNKPSATQFYGGLPAAIQNRVQSIASQFDRMDMVKDFNNLALSAQSISDLMKRPVGGPGDLAMIYTFMKALDPTSVVRESEYAAAAASGNIFAGWAARFNGYLSPTGGRLPDNMRKEFNAIIQQKMKTAAKQVRKTYYDFGRRIEKITGEAPGSGITYMTDYTDTFNDTAGSDSPADQPVTTRKVGDVVTLKDGRKTRITKIYPNGDYEVE